MKTAPNRMLLRLMYLWQMGAAYTLMCLTWVVGVLAFMITFILGIGLLFSLPYLTTGGSIIAVIIMGLIVLFAFVTFACIRLCEILFDKAEIIPYVPPVRDQIAYLPAEEVLLRSVAEPAVPQQNLLLRPAVGQASPAEELLRPVA